MHYIKINLSNTNVKTYVHTLQNCLQKIKSKLKKVKLFSVTFSELEKMPGQK